MNSISDTNKILNDILNIDPTNDFLKYIVERIKNDDYRGWHISQHNRYDLDTIEIILKIINEIVGEQYFEIPPGDYNKDADIPEYFNYKEIVNKIHEKLKKGTINSIKKNFFPDLDKMGFLKRKEAKRYGKLTQNAIELINSNNDIIKKYKKFTDGIDKLFGEKISELANKISLSDYRNDPISIYEFMFILSDKDDTTDKIKLLDEYRKLKKYQQQKVIKLIQEYANPKNFDGNKKYKRDFENWKNQIQQIMSLLKTTVYFEVYTNKFIRLNIGKTGFYQEPSKRSKIPKKDYFTFHDDIVKEDKFELHHVIPIKLAKNKEEAKLIDNHLNLIYIHKTKHKEFSKKDTNIVMEINPDEAIFADLYNKTEQIKAINNEDAKYTKEKNKIKDLNKYNAQLLKSIFEFEK